MLRELGKAGGPEEGEKVGTKTYDGRDAASGGVGKLLFSPIDRATGMMICFSVFLPLFGFFGFLRFRARL